MISLNKSLERLGFIGFRVYIDLGGSGLQAS